MTQAGQFSFRTASWLFSFFSLWNKMQCRFRQRHFSWLPALWPPIGYINLLDANFVRHGWFGGGRFDLVLYRTSHQTRLPIIPQLAWNPIGGRSKNAARHDSAGYTGAHRREVPALGDTGALACGSRRGQSTAIFAGGYPLLTFYASVYVLPGFFFHSQLEQMLKFLRRFGALAFILVLLVLAGYHSSRILKRIRFKEGHAHTISK
jgi:hypothetical protein